MAGIIKKLNKRIERVQRKKSKRKEIMGEHGMIKQDMRQAKTSIKASVTPGDSVAKSRGRQAVKRVGEYKAAKKKSQFTQAGKAKQHKTNF